MIVSTAKVLFFALTLIVCVLTIAFALDAEINWQVKYTMLAIALGCIGNITNWRRREPKILDLRLNK